MFRSRPQSEWVHPGVLCADTDVFAPLRLSSPLETSLDNFVINTYQHIPLFCGQFKKNTQ